MIPIHVESAWKGTSDCHACGIRDLVLFADLNEDDFSLIHEPIDDMAFPVGRIIYSEGEKAIGVFTLRHGMVKLVRSTADGRERIVRVLKAGDIVGIEALATGHYDSEAVALIDAKLCRIPLRVLHMLSTHSPRLHNRLMQKWQQALKGADDWLADLNFGTARQRVAKCILKMRHDDEPSHSTLFAREDMGAMMDLKLETVSREISGLVRDQVIQPLDKAGRLYRIQNENSLASA